MSRYKLELSETDIKRQIKQYLDILQNQGKLFHFHCLQGLGCFPGVPDKIILLPNGRTIWLEVKKSVTCKLSPNQELFRDKCFKLGHIYLVVFSFEDFKNNLDKITEGKVRL